ncbi:hypothetical protein EJ05DRAFT_508122 [Pseudovirgaria hyperparasitica]|uniref:HNH domain-containing protein n=1 Tax=Pseudovirgaria hyperparasitica TaxID=470096 RepID=A0A6A6WEC3_9PEZI|nr:uncharacterized protein EJ05DRAFT_508122 [Pseudovirgaria hyperparasitica]KAF2760885.1 hypothetical protein EJ05DRAFT_508122 [Pseudovirgaria hyperparasitica]
MPLNATKVTNFGFFRECLSESVLRYLAPQPEKQKKKKRKERRKSGSKTVSLSALSQASNDTAEDVIKKRTENGSWVDIPRSRNILDGHLSNHDDKSEQDTDAKDVSEAEELSEFIDFLAHGIFSDLPADLRSLTHRSFEASKSLQARYATPLSSDTVNRLVAPLPTLYVETISTFLPSLVASDPTFFEAFLSPVLTSYVEGAIAAPPPPSSTKDTADCCEICLREHMPLTYHHLIPKSVHDKVIKRGWHEARQLNDVAWLCRQCHSFVHRIAGNEELAREWYTVEKLLEREDVQRWARWCGGIRWKKK